MKLKAGKYYVGDLCYVIGDKWVEAFLDRGKKI